jgi:hypothetical protein
MAWAEDEGGKYRHQWIRIRKNRKVLTESKSEKNSWDSDTDSDPDTVRKKIKKIDVKHLTENKMHVFIYSIAKLFVCFKGFRIHLKAMRATL